MDARRSAQLVFALMLYVLASGIALLTWAGTAIEVPNTTLAIISAVAVWGDALLVGSCVYVLLTELFHARAEARDSGEPMPRMLGGLFIVYSLALLIFMYRCGYYLARGFGWDNAARAIASPPVAALFNAVTLVFALVSYLYIAQPAIWPRIRAVWRWLRRKQE